MMIKTYPSDTSSDAEQVQLRLLRQKSPTERTAMALRHSSEVIRASKRAISRVHPEFTERQIGHRFIQLHYGEEIANAVSMAGGSVMDGAIELVEALRPVLQELVRLGVRYYIGGSVASSSHGAGRSTLDADVVTELNEATALDLITPLLNDYYISRPAVLEAVRRRSCFNLIHLATSFKIDIFVSQDREFDRLVLERAMTASLGGSNPLSARIATAEDIMLLKLDWYRLGNETSQRQWDDLTQVAKLQSNRLDRIYLRHWANELGVADLLERLLTEVAA